MNKIVEMALNARTMKDAIALEKALAAVGATRTRYLGDRPANWSTLSNAAEPKALVFERDVNMFDGNLECEVSRQHPDLTKLTSPREAAVRLGFVPNGGIVEMSDAERRTVAIKSVITLLDSDDSKRKPTIAFRDKGIGVSRREAPYTILSLEGSNKLSKGYLHGVFGKGGNLATMFSDAVVMVMRKQPDLLAPQEPDQVTVVVIQREDREDVRLPYFRYLVCDSAEGAAGLPWACDATEASEFEPGVYVAHINYQADKMGQETWNQEESVYAVAETLLFRPTLPYGLEDRRSPDAIRRPEGRGVSILTGLGLRLDRLELDGEPAPLLRKSAFSNVTVPGVGTARVRWWLFRDRDKRRQYCAKGFVSVFTHDGQVHHSWDQQKFQTVVPKLRRVAERVFVEVDLEEIPRKQRIQILSSIRDALRKTTEARKLEEAIARWLEDDADLDEAETQFVREALQKSAQKMSKDFLDRLNRAIATKIPSLEILLNKKGTHPRPKPPKPQDDLYPEPTAFTGPAGVTILPGETHTFYMSINAVDSFVPDRGTIALDVPADAELTLAVGDLRRGRVQLSLAAGAEAALGTHQGTLMLSWLRAAGGVAEIRWMLNVSVLKERPVPPPPDPNKKKDGVGEKHGVKKSIVALVWNQLECQKDSGWTEETAGDMQQLSGAALAAYDEALYGNLKDVDTDIPTIVLNEDYALWRAYGRGSAVKSDAALKVRKERYAIAVGTIIANTWARENAIEKVHKAWGDRGANGDEPTKAMDEGQRRRAASEGARGILVVLPDFDRMASELEEAPA